MIITTNLQRQKKVEVLFSATIPPISDCVFVCFKFPTFRPLVLLIKVVLREDEYGTLVEWYWHGKTEVLGEKPAPVPLSSPHISQRSGQGLRGEKPASNHWSHGKAHFKTSSTLHLKTPVHTKQQTSRRGAARLHQLRPAGWSQHRLIAVIPRDIHDA
jgi:hypothetical protein